MRTNHEILVLGRDNFNKQFITGLCGMFTFGTYDFGLTQAEADKVLRYIDKNKPTPCMDYESDHNECYWWKRGLNKPRRLWLDKHIELTKPKNRKG